MAIATVIFHDRTVKQIKDADKAAAIDLYKAWKHNTPANDQQAAFIRHVKRVILPPSWKLAAGETPETPGQQLLGNVNDTWFRETQGKNNMYKD